MFGREILGKEEGGGELDGGSNKSDRSDADPGENGESRSISIGEPPSGFSLIGSTAETFAGNVVYRGCLFLKLFLGGGGELESFTPGDELWGWSERNDLFSLVGGDEGRDGDAGGGV